MLKASESEYSRLASETLEIKECITKYVGFIIGAFGIGGIIIKYPIENEPNVIIGLLFIVIITITFFLEIIWYKIESHNKTVGYMQLISQEQTFYKFNDKYLDEEKKYLISKGDILTLEEINELPKLATWEFVVSRLNTDQYLNQKEPDNHKAVEHAKYHFVPPRLLNFNSLDPNDFKDLDVNFFKDVIDKVYKQKTFKRNIITLKLLISSLKFIFSGMDRHKQAEKLEKLNMINNESNEENKIKEVIDVKYYISGWSYPIKVVQITLSTFFLLTFAIIYMMWSSYNFLYSQSISRLFKLNFGDIIISLNSWINLPTIYFILLIVIIYYWLWKFVFRLPQIIYGNGSIDYFCWKFFAYRIQLLNNAKIIPEYYCRSYIRYHKSIVILKKLDSVLSEINIKVLENHEACLFNKKSLESIEKTTNITEQILICNDCLNKYKIPLTNCSAFNPVASVIHNIIYPRFKMYMKNQREI